MKRFIGLLLLLALKCSPTNACHPQCTWQCDDPACPAICEANCTDTCPTSSCDNAGCTCESFSEAKLNNCTPPLESACPTCEAIQSGINCQKNNGQECSCNISCELTSCTWDCQTPSNCPKPKCELQCEEPTCQKSDVFP